MENSFFEYRDETGADSGSESEFIDNSLVDESFGVKKKNRTVFVAESEESTTDEESETEENVPKNASKSVVRQSSAANSHVISSSDDDASNRGSIRRQSESSNKVVLSSSDEEEVSPEIVPKRRPPMKKKSLNPNESIIGRKTKKRMFLIDSDTENSIIIEHDKHKKLQCLKDTPLKIVSGTDSKALESSMAEDNQSENNESNNDEEKINESAKSDRTIPLKYDETDDSEECTGEDDEQTDDDGPDEDQMVMSRATRMSIMGVIPKDNESDESDFIQSDDSPQNSNYGSTVSLTDLPEATLPVTHKSPEKTPEDQDSSRITCSPFSSPLQDITNESRHARKFLGTKDECIIINDTEQNAPKGLKNTVLNHLIAKKERENFIRYDDDVTIIDTKPEIIALSSDDDDEVPTEKKSPKLRKSKSPNPPKQEENIPMKPDSLTIKKYLAPPSYPSQQVVYVQKHERESELMKLEALKEDLKNIRYLLEEMDVDSLPDRGSKLIERLTLLEENVRRQGDKVANMVVEPAGKDKQPPSWDELQKASNAVQPRMFGKQGKCSRSSLPDPSSQLVERLTQLLEPAGKDKPPSWDELQKASNAVQPRMFGKQGKSSRSSLPDPSSQLVERLTQLLEPAGKDKPPSWDELQKASNAVQPRMFGKQGKSSRSSLPDPSSQLVERLTQLLEPAGKDKPPSWDELQKASNAVQPRMFGKQGKSSRSSLPDPSSQLVERLTQLLEPAGKDKPPSWDELQKASNAVQPRMFGKQAMATHMAERHLILDRLRDLYESLGSRPAESEEAPAPRAMKSKLMPHQLHALAWLRWRETQRPRAGILADDMGLGKTITMIALIVSDKEDKIDEDEEDDDDPSAKKLVRGGTLVVCPASLMQQWSGEVSKHCTSHALSVCLHHGAARATVPHRLATYDLVLTTYNIMQRDNEKKGVLMRIRWRRVILDEAHVVRNHKSATCAAVSALHAQRRWCLTGTPVQNKDLDLFALLKFLRCSPFDELTVSTVHTHTRAEQGPRPVRAAQVPALLSLRRAHREYTHTHTHTHTHVQNKDLDLFALLKFLRCSPFDELTVSTVHTHTRAEQGPRPVRAAQVPALLSLRRAHREYTHTHTHTHTHVQNKDLDLFALLKFLRCSPFDELTNKDFDLFALLKFLLCSPFDELTVSTVHTHTHTHVQNKDLDLFALLKFLRCSPFDELTVSTVHTHTHTRAEQGPRPVRAAQVPALLSLRRAHREYSTHTHTHVQNKDLDLFALLKFLRCSPFDELTNKDLDLFALLKFLRCSPFDELTVSTHTPHTHTHTHTHVQNKDLDLFALLKFLRCSPFDELTNKDLDLFALLKFLRCSPFDELTNKDLDLFALLKFLRCSPFDELTVSTVHTQTHTHTHVQNKDLDLFALLKFLRCSPFDELTFLRCSPFDELTVSTVHTHTHTHTHVQNKDLDLFALLKFLRCSPFDELTNKDLDLFALLKFLRCSPFDELTVSTVHTHTHTHTHTRAEQGPRPVRATQVPALLSLRRAHREYSTHTHTRVQNKDLDLFALLKFLRCSPFDELTVSTHTHTHTHTRAEQGPRPVRAAQVPALLSLRRAHREYSTHTHTHVQNKDLDLFALLKFLRCSPFDELTMWKKWIDNKSLGGQERLNTIMQCLLLRRTKVQLVQRGQLACLPQRTAHVKTVTLSQQEMNVYQKVLVFSKTLFAQFLHQRAEKNADAQGFTAAGKDTAFAKMHKKMIALQGAQPVKSHEILVLLLRLRQVCCHCGLIAAMLDEESAADVQEDPAGQDLLAELNKLSLDEQRDKRKSQSRKSDDEDEDGPMQEGTTAAEAIRSVLSPNNPVFHLSNPSSKIKAVMDCLNTEVFVNKGDKAVVVSQWTSVLRLVEEQLTKAKVRSVTLSGNVPVPARQPLLEKINDPKSDVKVCPVLVRLYNKAKVRSVTLSGNVPVPARQPLLEKINDPKSDVKVCPVLVRLYNKAKVRSVTLSGNVPVPARQPLLEKINDPKSDVKVCPVLVRLYNKAKVRSVTLSGNVPVPARQPLLEKINDPKSDVKVCPVLVRLYNKAKVRSVTLSGNVPVPARQPLLEKINDPKSDVKVCPVLVRLYNKAKVRSVTLSGNVPVPARQPLLEKINDPKSDVKVCPVLVRLYNKAKVRSVTLSGNVPVPARQPLLEKINDPKSDVKVCPVLVRLYNKAKVRSVTLSGNVPVPARQPLLEKINDPKSDVKVCPVLVRLYNKAKVRSVTLSGNVPVPARQPLLEKINDPKSDVKVCPVLVRLYNKAKVRSVTLSGNVPVPARQPLLEKINDPKSDVKVCPVLVRLYNKAKVRSVTLSGNVPVPARQPLLEKINDPKSDVKVCPVLVRLYNKAKVRSVTLSGNVPVPARQPLLEKINDPKSDVKVCPVLVRLYNKAKVRSVTLSGNVPVPARQPLLEKINDPKSDVKVCPVLVRLYNKAKVRSVTLSGNVPVPARQPLLEKINDPKSDVKVCPVLVRLYNKAKVRSVTLSGNVPVPARQPLLEKINDPKSDVKVCPVLVRLYNKAKVRSVTLSGNVPVPARQPLLEKINDPKSDVKVCPVLVRLYNKAKVRSVTLSGNVPVPARQPLLEKINDPKSDVKVCVVLVRLYNKAKVRSVTLSGNVPVPARQPLLEKINDPKSDVKVCPVLVRLYNKAKVRSVTLSGNVPVPARQPLLEKINDPKSDVKVCPVLVRLYNKAKVRSVTLSGNVPVPARQPLLEKINDPKSDVKVMLLSLCAGGVGLNLCGANHLLLLDPHWNPQLEEQAQDRIYRVGQAKDVNIYRFMCVDTVEQSIRKLQQAKLELAENVLTGAKNSNNSKLTIEDLKVLFNMGQ
ncbi:hypothetical protein PYW07_007664 [Mythimna separata]|uniref:Helicase ATP-binding domain-containing protein n=1 Tax=Mythimna separata TaxID=271217 RepID=A0AAD7YPZ1_MYTSE|nr:hypothetical protein PYW07_007664 [Mythimna separata]